MKRVSGVAVAVVAADVRGRVERVEVLQAPDANIARAVEQAVAQWMFAAPSTDDRTPAALMGKLTFYFEIDGSQGRVLAPTEKAQATIGRALSEWKVPEEDFERLRRSAHVIILDIREEEAFKRRHRSGATNIPFHYLSSRAKQELPLTAVIAIDCYPNDALRLCRSAYWELTQLGFGHPIILTHEPDAAKPSALQ